MAGRFGERTYNKRASEDPVVLSVVTVVEDGAV